MTIHASDPFATPEPARSPIRRFRGRLPAPVTLWTAYGTDGRPAGLTVSSMMVADGEPGAILGLIDEESDLYAALIASGRVAIAVLRHGDDQLADRFAGLFPAPGGLFADGRWDRTEYGPVRSGGLTWAGCRLAATEPVGYGQLVRVTVETVHLDDAPAAPSAPVTAGPPATAGPPVTPLLRHRGRYRTVAR